jgi:hypothetical protein
MSATAIASRFETPVVYPVRAACSLVTGGNVISSQSMASAGTDHVPC